MNLTPAGAVILAVAVVLELWHATVSPAFTTHTWPDPAVTCHSALAVGTVVAASMNASTVAAARAIAAG